MDGPLSTVKKKTQPFYGPHQNIIERSMSDLVDIFPVPYIKFAFKIHGMCCIYVRIIYFNTDSTYTLASIVSVEMNKGRLNRSAQSYITRRIGWETQCKQCF